MNFRWETLLELAQSLAQEAENEPLPMREAMRRASISRAYYAVFNVAARWLREQYPHHALPTHGEIHQSVIDFFNWSSAAEHRQIGRLMERLRTARNQADYKNQIADLPETTQRALFQANRVLNQLSALENQN